MAARARGPMKIKFVILDFYNVLYFAGKDEVNVDIIDFVKQNNKKVGFGVLSAVNSDLSEWFKKRDLLQDFVFIKTTSELKLPKTDPGIYETVVNGLNLKPSQVLLIDDLGNNLSAAQKAGLQTLKFVKNKTIIDQLKDSNINI